jgi:uncharacterized protein YxjI
MKKLIATLISLLLCINNCFALTNNEIPDEFTITERWISATNTFDIATKTEKLGTLYRKFFSLLLTYEFLDSNNNKLATARARFFSLTAHFDIYDNNNALLGVAEEKFFAFYPTFDIYGNDSTTKLASAKMNFWGTTFTVIDPASGQEMAVMSRPYFSFKNNWTFKVVNRHLLMKKNIDPRVLLTVIAFQSDREYWRTIYTFKSKSVSSAGQDADATTSQINMIKQSINNISKSQNLADNTVQDKKMLEALTEELDIGFKNSQVKPLNNRTNEEMISDFTDYCLNLAQSNTVSDTKKKAILHLLELRLEGHKRK